MLQIRVTWSESGLSPWYRFTALLLRSLSVPSPRLAVFFCRNNKQTSFPTADFIIRLTTENCTNGGLTTGVPLNVIQEVGRRLGCAQPEKDLCSGRKHQLWRKQTDENRILADGEDTSDASAGPSVWIFSALSFQKMFWQFQKVSFVSL